MSTIYKYNTCNKAALVGDLDCLKYAHENGCEWNRWIPANASLNGHLDCLKYAHENGCEWDNYTTSNATLNDHLDCLKYAHENGCEWNENTPIYAAKNNNLNCFKYCFENWSSDQEFWNINPDGIFPTRPTIEMLEDNYQDIYKNDKINLDDPVWRRLLKLNLKNYPELANKIEVKKETLRIEKEETMKSLINYLPKDIIEYCIYEFF